MRMPPRRINISRFIQHQINPLLRHDFINSLIIRLYPHRSLLVPPVPRQIYQTIRSSHHNRRVTRNRMQSVDKLHRKMLRNLNILMLKRIHRTIIHIWRIFKFRHLFLNHSNRKFRRINRRQIRKFRQQMATRPNMI